MKLFLIAITVFGVSSIYGQATFETNTHDLRPQQYVPQLPNDEIYRALESKQRQYDQSVQHPNNNHQAQTSRSGSTPVSTPTYNSHFDPRKGHSLYFVKHHPKYYVTD